MATQMTIQDELDKIQFTDLLFAIKDLKAGTYSAPFVALTEGEAQRIFTSMVCYGGDNLISKYPSDYELFKIGKYDKRLGTLIQSDIEFIISAEGVKNLETVRIANNAHKQKELLKSDETYTDYPEDK